MNYNMSFSFIKFSSFFCCLLSFHLFLFCPVHSYHLLSSPLFCPTLSYHLLCSPLVCPLLFSPVLSCLLFSPVPSSPLLFHPSLLCPSSSYSICVFPSRSLKERIAQLQSFCTKSSIYYILERFNPKQDAQYYRG